jgi:hypothetical protein
MRPDGLGGDATVRMTSGLDSTQIQDVISTWDRILVEKRETSVKVHGCTVSFKLRRGRTTRDGRGDPHATFSGSDADIRSRKHLIAVLYPGEADDCVSDDMSDGEPREAIDWYTGEAIYWDASMQDLPDLPSSRTRQRVAKRTTAVDAEEVANPARAGDEGGENQERRWIFWDNPAQGGLNEERLATTANEAEAAEASSQARILAAMARAEAAEAGAAARVAAAESDAAARVAEVQKAARAACAVAEADVPAEEVPPASPLRDASSGGGAWPWEAMAAEDLEASAAGAMAQAAAEGLTLERSACSSRFVGVFRNAHSFVAQMVVCTTSYQHLGRFHTAEEAALAFARARLASCGGQGQEERKEHK